MNDCMTFPDTVEEFMEQYKVVDTEHIYTNGSEFVPIFRMKQWFDHLPSVQPDTTTHDSIPAETGKNDGDGTSGDCISRQQSIDALRKMQTYKLFAGDDMILIDKAEVQTELMGLPSVQPEQRWIPVTERLPEEGEVVLTQAKFKDDVKMAVSSRIDYNYWTGWGTRDINIIAWMPLPEPYQKRGDQDGMEK